MIYRKILLKQVAIDGHERNHLHPPPSIAQYKTHHLRVGKQVLPYLLPVGHKSPSRAGLLNSCHQIHQIQ